MAERDDESFLSRWSRLKRLPDEPRETGPGNLRVDETEADSLPVPEEFEADELPQRVLETPEEELSAVEREWLENRRRAEAVDLDTVVYESDFALFLKRGVPLALRRRALRKLWVSNPLLANLDGLNDYEENFGDPALNTFKSAWQVGRGFLGGDDPDDRPAGTGETGSVRHDTAREAPSPADDAGEGNGSEDTEDTVAAETDIDTKPSETEPDRSPTSRDPADDAPQRVSLRRRWNLDNS